MSSAKRPFSPSVDARNAYSVMKNQHMEDLKKAINERAKFGSSTELNFPKLFDSDIPRSWKNDLGVFHHGTALLYMYVGLHQIFIAGRGKLCLDTVEGGLYVFQSGISYLSESQKAGQISCIHALKRINTSILLLSYSARCYRTPDTKEGSLKSLIFAAILVFCHLQARKGATDLNLISYSRFKKLFRFLLCLGQLRLLIPPPGM